MAADPRPPRESFRRQNTWLLAARSGQVGGVPFRIVCLGAADAAARGAPVVRGAGALLLLALLAARGGQVGGVPAC